MKAENTEGQQNNDKGDSDRSQERIDERSPPWASETGPICLSLGQGLREQDEAAEGARRPNARAVPGQ